MARPPCGLDCPLFCDCRRSRAHQAETSPVSTLPTKLRGRPRSVSRGHAPTGGRTRCVRGLLFHEHREDQVHLNELLLQTEGDAQHGTMGVPRGRPPWRHAGLWPLRRVEHKVNYANVQLLQARVLRYSEKME